MRRLLVAVVVLVTAGGCGTDPPSKSGPAFALDAPASVELLKDDTRTIDVAVKWDRGEREDLDVSAAIEPADKLVSAKVVKPRLERGAGPAQVTVSAGVTAAPGDYKLTVTAKG